MRTRSRGLCLLVRGSRLPPAQHLPQTPGRNERPDALEQQEAELLLVPGENCKDCRANQVRDQVGARARVEQAKLPGRVGDEDQQGPGDLGCLWA